MTNRKLKKILKANIINPNEKEINNASSESTVSRIPRKFILRTAQIAACFIIAGAVCFGWVMMVRMVGRQGNVGESTEDGQNEKVTESNPAFNVEVTTNESGNESITFNGESADFENFKFTDKNIIFYYLDVNRFPDVTVKEMTGEIVSDTVFMRSEYLSKSMELVPTYNIYNNVDIIIEEVKTSVLSGNSTGIVVANSKVITELIILGSFCDMLSTKYLDLTKDYWTANLVSDLSVGGKLYLASGNISPNTTVSVYMTIFNKTLFSTNGLNSPYELVKSGNWTFENLFKTAVDVYIDIDGTGTATPADQFNLTSTADGINALAFTAGIQLINNDNNTLSISKSLTNGSAVAFCEMLSAEINSSKAYLNTSEVSFTKNTKLVFGITTLGSMLNNAPAYFDIGYEIGFLPLPKYNENSDYITPVSDSAVYYAITNGSDTDIASAVLQYYAFSINDIEMIFRVKYSTDADSSDNLKLINDSLTFNLGQVFSSRIGNLSALIPSVITGGADGIKNAFANLDAYRTAISELASALK